MKLRMVLLIPNSKSQNFRFVSDFVCLDRYEREPVTNRKPCLMGSMWFQYTIFEAKSNFPSVRAEQAPMARTTIFFMTKTQNQTTRNRSKPSKTIDYKHNPPRKYLLYPPHTADDSLVTQPAVAYTYIGEGTWLDMYSISNCLQIRPRSSENHCASGALKIK